MSPSSFGTGGLVGLEPEFMFVTFYEREAVTHHSPEVLQCSPGIDWGIEEIV